MVTSIDGIVVIVAVTTRSDGNVPVSGTAHPAQSFDRLGDMLS
jgi:hypothetical protein